MKIIITNKRVAATENKVAVSLEKKQLAALKALKEAGKYSPDRPFSLPKTS